MTVATLDLQTEIARARRIADIIAAHTDDACHLAIAYYTQHLDDTAFQQQMLTRCKRTALALLAVLHEKGPP